MARLPFVVVGSSINSGSPRADDERSLLNIAVQDSLDEVLDRLGSCHWVPNRAWCSNQPPGLNRSLSKTIAAHGYLAYPVRLPFTTSFPPGGGRLRMGG